MHPSLRFLVALLFLGLGGARAGSNVQPAAEVLPGRGLCAHRGAMSTHPENTLAAFREAIRCGAHMIEFDAQLTKDQKLVIMHDPTVNRTTNGKGKVAALTFQELRQLDAGSWKSPDFKGEQIPTLEETLALMPVNIWLNVHLKGDEAAGRQAAEVLVQQGRLQQAFLACNAAAAKGAQTVNPQILICNMERQRDAWDYVELTVSRKAAFIQLTGKVSTNMPGYVKELKKHGVRINYFGTVQPEQLRTLFALGIEFPLVNDLAASLKVAATLGIAPVQPVFRREEETTTRP